MNALHKRLEKKLGKDGMKANEMMITGIMTKKEHAPGHVWADYMFLCACYSSVQEDTKRVNYAVKQIKTDFPNYDPSKRFTWDAITEGLETEDMVNKTDAGNAFRYRAPVIGQMNHFCEDHPDFSFAEKLGDYFNGAKSMGIKKDQSAPESGLIKENNGRYSLNQALED